MDKRIVSVMCCLPLLLGGVTDKVLDKSNLHNRFEVKQIHNNQYPLQDKKSRFNRINNKAKELRKQQMIKEIGEGFKQLKLQEEHQKKREQEIHSRGLSGDVEEVNFTLSFYSTDPSENGGYTVTCTGEPLQYGMVASNVYPLGTKIYLEGYGLFTVADRGGNHFDNYNRLDVLIPPLYEGEQGYKRRVNNMGKPKVKGYVQIK
ncbi:MAG: 3D domain-containing protein [Clostridium chrysemydis]|uniref:3D domain-containing protein n=1 Tax=Clostridium chrysemydis TaxID=2665504 RepID=UPI003F2A102D